MMIVVIYQVLLSTKIDEETWFSKYKKIKIIFAQWGLSPLCKNGVPPYNTVSKKAFTFFSIRSGMLVPSAFSKGWPVMFS